MALVNKAKGFSLIELVTVVIIIGLLAMIGIPKYIQLMDRARDVGVQSQASIFAGAVLSARTQWVANDRSKKADTQGRYNHTEFDGSSLWLTDKDKGFLSDGYPVIPSQGDYKVSLTDQDCADLMIALLQNPPHVLAESGFDPEQEQEVQVRYLARAQGQSCQYLQQEGNNNHFVYDMNTGQVIAKLEK